MKKTTIIVLVLTILGVGLVAVAAILEARSYPWQHRLGLTMQDAAALPEPSPIVPDEEGAVIVYMEAVESPDAPEETGTPTEAPDVLPGAEEEVREGEEPAASPPAQKQYTVIGTLKIPALNVSQNILEGTGKELKYGVGRLTLSAYPGEKGNCVIAGHRPYPFRYLNMLTQGDTISIRFNGMTYTYSVYESFEVLPTETWVLSRVDGHPYTLTLITCTPYMVSSHRLIVRAELTAIDGVPFKDPAAAGGEAPSADGEGEDALGADGEGEGALPAGETVGAGGETGVEGASDADTGTLVGSSTSMETPSTRSNPMAETPLADAANSAALKAGSE